MRYRLADAAASAAFSGAFAPLVMGDVEFPCSARRVVKLLDDGAYDNLGLEVVDDLRDAFLVAVNAGGLFHTRRFGGLPLVRNLVRVNSLLYQQSTSLRQREMIGRFHHQYHPDCRSYYFTTQSTSLVRRRFDGRPGRQAAQEDHATRFEWSI